MRYALALGTLAAACVAYAVVLDRADTQGAAQASPSPRVYNGGCVAVAAPGGFACYGPATAFTPTPRPRPTPTPTVIPCAWYRQAADRLTARSEHALGLGHDAEADKYARGADTARYAYDACENGRPR